MDPHNGLGFELVVLAMGLGGRTLVAARSGRAQLALP
jgi:hypothetical protein